MLTIQNEFIHEIEIKKSRFICHMNYVKDEQEAKEYIGKINGIHPNATHNCTAYKCGVVVRVDDDGEPGGTAGLPMLEVLNHHDFDYICIVVTRYFGGVKLGAGGLIRAYAKAVSEAIKVAPVEELVPGMRCEIKASYTDTKSIEYMLNLHNYVVESTNYEMDVKYSVLVDEEKYEKLKQQLNDLNHLIKLSIKENIYIAKQG